MFTLFKNRSVYTVVFSVVLSIAFVAVVASAASTISTNISTGGTLTVTGVAQMDGSLQASSTALVTGAATLYATTTLNGAAPFLMGQSSTDLTGQAEGTTFYDTTNKVIRLYDGANWFTVGTTTSGLTLSATRLQMANLATDHLAFGTTTVQSESLLTLEATTTTAIPLTIVGIFGQTGDLFNAVSCPSGGCASAYTELFAIDDDGSASTTGAITAGTGFFLDVRTFWNTTALNVNGFATTTAATGNIATEGTLAVNGNATLGDATADVHTFNGNASTTQSHSVGVDLYVGENATTSANGNISTQGSLTVGPSSSLSSAVNRIVTGVCVLNLVAVTASSTAYAVCGNATGVTSGDTVLVQATSSLLTSLYIAAASSTPVAGEVSVLLANTGYADAVATTSTDTLGTDGNLSALSFWAFR